MLRESLGFYLTWRESVRLSLYTKTKSGKEYAWPAGGVPPAEGVVARQYSEGRCWFETLRLYPKPDIHPRLKSKSGCPNSSYEPPP